MVTGISAKKLSDIDSDLERGVFSVNYKSGKQRRRRMTAKLLLTLKHSLRGVLFSWPLYLLPFSALALTGVYTYLFIVFLLPGVMISYTILSRGVREDYAKYVTERLLSKGYVLTLLLNRDLERQFDR